MGIPAFENDGFLPPGLHVSTGEEFLARFCVGAYRTALSKAVTDVLDFASAKGATRVIAGGSFVTAKDTPHDFDCVIVFAEANQIPERVERVELDKTSLDIFYCSEDQEKLLGGMAALFQRSWSGRDVGAVDIHVRDNSGRALWEIVHHPDDETLEIIRATYFNRHITRRAPNDRTLVTVHGIRSYGGWSADVCHLASSNGWTVAPFHYGHVGASIFLQKTRRAQIVQEFRDHMWDMQTRYGPSISVIAHSFGTYVVVKYLLGFQPLPPVGIDTLILTGSVLDETLDLDRFEGRAARIINEVAPNDEWVGYPPLFRWNDKLYGQSGRKGFKQGVERLEEYRSEIFNHTNVTRRDVIAQRWMPWLEANVGSCGKEAFKLTVKMSTEERVQLQKNSPPLNLGKIFPS